MLSSLPFLLAVLLAGCALGDSEQVDCLCAPDTSVQLFPHCDSVAEERPDPRTPLSTQIPDCPSGPQLFLLNPTRPEAVLANLASIFQAQSEKRSPQQYMDQFTDDFVFIPDPGDVQLNPEIYDADRDTLWGAAEERNFARLILSPERIHSAHFVRWLQIVGRAHPDRRRAARDLQIPLRSRVRRDNQRNRDRLRGNEI